MFDIINKEELNTTVMKMDIYAPLIANKAKPGQFVILRVDNDGERIPLTIADYDLVNGTITIIFQIVGATTLLLSKLNVGDKLCDLVGPLGNPSKLDNLKRVIVIGGGVGSAIAYPIAKALNKQGCEVTVILGFRNKELVILEESFKKICDALYIMTDDGSYQEKGLVTNKLAEMLEIDTKYDEVITIGPLIMMKYVTLLTKKYHVKTTVSMNTIMIDGTGMCGGCRLRVDNKTVFACVDGPDFDGHLVDFDEAMKRAKMYNEFEQHTYDDACNLFKKKVQ